MGQVEVGRNWLCQFLPHANFKENQQKVQLGTSLFFPEVSVHQPNQVKLKMASQLPGMVNPALHGESDSGKSNAARATAKRQKEDGKQELPKVSNTHIGRACFAGTKIERRPAPGPSWRPLGALGRPHGAQGDLQAQTTTEALHRRSRLPPLAMPTTMCLVGATMEWCLAPGGRLRGGWVLPRGARGEPPAQTRMEELHGRQRQGDVREDASAAMATTPKQRWQWYQRDNRKDASTTTATLATAPAPRPRLRQRHDGDNGNGTRVTSARMPAQQR
jgi:hypothetical protein